MTVTIHHKPLIPTHYKYQQRGKESYITRLDKNLLSYINQFATNFSALGSTCSSIEVETREERFSGLDFHHMTEDDESSANATLMKYRSKIQRVCFGREMNHEQMVSMFDALHGLDWRTSFSDQVQQTAVACMESLPFDFSRFCSLGTPSYAKLKSIDLSFCSDINDAFLIYAAPLVPSLERISLCHREVSDDAMIAIATHCPNLKSVNISYCDRISDRTIHKISNSCSKLEHISISGCKRITDSSIQPLVSSCKYLNRMHLDGTSITEKSFESIASECKRLTHLYVSGISILDKHLIALSKGNPHLESISLNSCSRLTDKSILELCKNCRNLKYLSLQSCALITDVSIFNLAKYSRSLEHLDVSRNDSISMKYIKLLFMNCHDLNYINLNLCTQVPFSDINQELRSHPHLACIFSHSLIN